MKSLLCSLLVMFFVGACSHAPVQVNSEWVIQPASPDQKLSLDEQFLKKSQDNFQAVTSQRKGNRTF